MPFSITVLHPEDLDFVNRVPENDDEMDQWIEEFQRRNLYEAPLGAGGVVYLYWSGIGRQLHLPFIGAMYNEGLRLTTAEIPKLEIEMQQLERYWQANDLVDVEKFDWDQVSAKKHLKERLRYLREAAKVATRNRAVLIVS